MQEITSGNPAELEIEAPPGLLPNLSEWGIEEVERGVCEDSAINRRTIRQNKAKFNTVFDAQGFPTGYLQVISAEMYTAAQGLSKTDLLTDPDDYNSDYQTGLALILSESAQNTAPTWVLNTTRTYIRQQEERRDLGPDADLHQSRLVATPTRCNTMKSDGTRCWGWSNGALEMQGMCRVHARRSGKIAPVSVSNAQLTRARLASAAPGAVEELETLAYSAESEQVRLGALKDILDRAGYKAAIEIEQKVEVQVTDAAETVKSRLAKLRQGQEEKEKLLRQIHNAQANSEIVDAEVVDDDE